MKGKNGQTIKLKRVFGLVGRGDDASLFLARSLTPLGPVLESIENNENDGGLFARHKGIKPEEIKAAKAYACRFGTDARNPQGLPPGRKGLLLDENISYALLPLASRLFGVSSHVEAEGLSRQNPAECVSLKNLDRQILRFAVQHEFSAILTCDSDFAHMHKKADNPAGQTHIIVIERGKNAGSIEQLLQNSGPLIRNTLEGAPRLTFLHA